MKNINMNINDFIKTEYGHIRLDIGNGVKCAHCGCEMSNRHPKSFQSHIMELIGFTSMHKDCVDGEPHSIFGKDFGVKKSRKK